MATRPRIKDVARRAGVSEKTVSNVINDYPHVTEKTRGAVREAIAELGYRVNLTGRHLRRGRTGIIALVLPELDQDYFAEIAKHIIKEAESRSTTVLVHQTEGRRDRELAALDGFDADFADGLIFSPLTMAHDDLRRHRARLPVVLLGERTAPGLHDHVAIDNVAAAREATEHLLGLGRRRIAVLGGRLGPDLGTAELRTQGHREAIEAAGLEFDPALVRPAGAFLWQDGAELTEELLSRRPPDPTRCCASTTTSRSAPSGRCTRRASPSPMRSRWWASTASPPAATACPRSPRSPPTSRSWPAARWTCC